MPEFTVYRHSPITGPDVPESPTYLGDWNYKPDAPPLPDDYLWSDLLAGSDYAGEALTRSNHAVFIEEYGTVDGVLDVYGDYSTYGVLIRREVYDSNESIRETLARLDSYPVLDEDHMSQVETDAENDAWESWACADFKRELAKRFPESEDVIDDMDSGTLRELLETTSDGAGIYWENETGNSAYIDLEKIAAAVDLAALESLRLAHYEDGDIAHAERMAESAS